MARILYGVHGTGHGHAIRALTIARSFPDHEFLFVSHDTGAAILGQEYPVVALPSLITVVRSHRVATLASLIANARIWLQRKQVVRRLLEIIDHFQPQVTMSDYDFFLPQIACRLGLPNLSIDHQHIITCCHHSVPWSKWPDYLALSMVVRFLFSQAADFIVTSFFRPPLKPGLNRVRLVPPLLRGTVMKRRPWDGDHVVAYQGYQTFTRFFPFLSAIPRPVFVYGFDHQRTEGNLHFKKTSEEGFLEDLASCHYVICGGSHSLISEALFYGKPVLSFPIKNAFEQFLNAFYLERLGYGLYSLDHRPGPMLLKRFEARLDDFRNNIRREQFCGNEEISHLVDQFIRQKGLND